MVKKYYFKRTWLSNINSQSNVTLILWENYLHRTKPNKRDAAAKFDCDLPYL